MSLPNHLDVNLLVRATYLTSPDLLRCSLLDKRQLARSTNLVRDITSAAFYHTVFSLQERQREYAINGFFTPHIRSAELFLDAVYRLSDRFLILEASTIRFVAKATLEWVEKYSSLISTLPLMAGTLAKSIRTGNNNLPNTIREIFNGPIIPLPDDSHMKELLDIGFAEVHLHFANSSHPAQIWDQALRCPANWISAFQNDGKLKKMWVNLFPKVDCRELAIWLKIAKSIREWLVCWINGSSYLQLDALEAAALGIERACNSPRIFGFSMPKLPLIYQRHPVEQLPGFSSNDSSIVLEGALWTLSLMKLECDLSSIGARMLHLYQLISSVVFKLSVHPLNYTGFDLFEVLAQNPLRDVAEKTICRETLYQIIQSGHLTKLEVRVAGKESEPDFVDNKLAPILTAYHSLQQKAPSLPGGSLPDFGIICHFIKKPDTSRILSSTRGMKVITIPRHAQLRDSLVVQLGVFLQTRNGPCGKYLIGIDGAGNELCTPPEVFAPIFRELRYRLKIPPPRKNFLSIGDLPKVNFTFHAGEDFFHLISGIRSIEEAVTFLDLPHGSRLGHCVALGLQPQWWFQMNPEMQMPKIQRLDDLVWILRFAEDQKLRHDIKAEIDLLSHEIYKKTYNPYTLYRAWQWRHLGVAAREQTLPSQKELKMALIAKGELDRNSKITDPELRTLFYDYHFRLSCYEEGEKVITIRTSKDIVVAIAAAVEKAQEDVKRLLITREISIETCPSSNIRITQLNNNLDGHPIFQWHPLANHETNGLMPLIATDNPGYCQTSLPMEYCAIKQAALRKAENENNPVSTRQLQNWLNTMNNDTHSRSFLK